MLIIIPSHVGRQDTYALLCGGTVREYVHKERDVGGTLAEVGERQIVMASGFAADVREWRHELAVWGP